MRAQHAVAIFAALICTQCQGSVQTVVAHDGPLAERGAADSAPDGSSSKCTVDEAALGEYCYRAVGVGSMDYQTARSSCQAVGGVPTSIHSAEENEVVRGLLYIWTKCGWIGLKRRGGSFTWEDGTPLDYKNWQAGEPGADACGCMNGPAAATQVQGQWQSTSCTSQSRDVVCKRKP